MTLEETRKTLTMLRINYPQSFLHLSNEDSQMLINQYYTSFKDDEANLVMSAIQYIVNTDTREYAPNIATIRKAMGTLTKGEVLSEEEAWSIVKQALSNSIYGYKDEYAKLPRSIQRVVGRPETLKEWAIVELPELDTVIASNFMRSYRNVAEQERKYEALPNDIKKLVNSSTKMIGEI